MALKNYEGRHEEIEALKGIDGIDPAQIMEQVTGVPAEPASGKPPQPPAGTPPAAQPKPSEAGSPPEAAGILKEIFGDQFTSVEDLKKQNIPEVLKEVGRLRELNQSLSQEKEELSGKLNVKPKNNFANDDVALFNEFVKTTGIRSFDVFSRLNGKEVANMDDMDAIILTRLLENPELAAKETQLRKHVEKTYNVDPEQVSEDELDVNKIGLAQEGARARKALQEIKGKLKIPENDQPAPETLSWTPEQEVQAKAVWNTANKAMGEKLSKIPIFLPGSKDPIINFAISEEMQNTIQANALNYALGNHMEANEENITTIAKAMYSELIVRNLDQIAHSVFEKARSLTKEESLKYYHNPTPLNGGDTPPAGRGEGDDEDAAKQKIFDAEYGRV